MHLEPCHHLPPYPVVSSPCLFILHSGWCWCRGCTARQARGGKRTMQVQPWKQTHRKVHVFNSAKNNIYFINFGGEIGQSKSINLSEDFRIA